MSTTQDLMGLGMPPALASRLGNNPSSVAGIGTTQLTAAALQTPVTLANPAAGASAFLLPLTGSTGRAFWFWNQSATVSAVVFPPPGGAINGGAANASVSIPPLTGAIFQLLNGSGTAAELWGCNFSTSTMAETFPQTQYTAIATNTPVTLTGAQEAGAADVTINMTAALAGAGTLNSATAAQIIAAIPDVTPGFSYNLRIINSSSGAFAWTLTTETGITLSGTMTIAQNTFRDFYVSVTSLTAVTIQSVGTGTNS